jgi:acyl-coenzyme A thioesterase PaaI-like protein
VPAERLDASRFGIDSRCFVCDDRNPRGLQVPFFHDPAEDVVFADFELPTEFQGAPTLVHGGATLALLDEAMSWATIALGGKFAYTGETTARFAWPVRVGRPYRVEARVAGCDERRLTTEAVVLDAKRRVCVTASATMLVLDAAQARDAGVPVRGDDDDAYLRGEPGPPGPPPR